jgi:ubiquinone/menaquinone biosynthesis C-methylase UbiE
VEKIGGSVVMVPDHDIRLMFTESGIDRSRQSMNINYATEYAKIGLVGQYLLAAQIVREKLMPFKEEIHYLVDFGCGAGKSTRAASNCVKEGGTVVGVDICGDMLREARILNKNLKDQLPRVKFHYKKIITKNGLEKIPLADEVADAVITTIVLVEIQTEEQLQNAFREMGRITKPGGHFVAINPSDKLTCEDFTAFTYAPFLENKERKDNIRKCQSLVSNIIWEKERHWSREILVQFAEEAGFKNPSVEYPLADKNLPPFPDDPSRPWKDELNFSPFIVLSARKV